MRVFTLEVLSTSFAICRVDVSEPIPNWAAGELVSITRTPDELSIVCPQENVPSAIRSESGWRGLRVVGRLDFALVGVIASLTEVLAAANISVFVVSTFDTDYLLVREIQLPAATDARRAAGHSVNE
jgi:hypothetical protein